jgi:nucleoside-diphosphate-sugar epimerase
VAQLAEMVREVVGPQVKLTTVPTNDPRSYHVSSEKIAKELGFVAKHSIEEAVRDMKVAFEKGLLPDSLSDPRYFNVKLMQDNHLK